jgi:hypothetical protein
VNYIKEINAFRNYLKTNSLEAITQALWYVIADYHNSSNWDRWIAIDNQRLAAELCISEKTLIKHRNKLIQAGLLEYKSQQRKKGSGRYKLLSFELGEAGKKETVEQTAENITPDKKADGKTTVKNTPDKKAERKAVQGADWKADRSDLYKLNETKLNDINTSTTTETKEDNFKNNFDEEFKELAQLYQKCGFDVNGLTPDWLMDLKERFGFEWVKNAILEAEKQGARRKAYVEKILSNWQRWGGMKLSTDNKPDANRSAATPAAKKTKFHNFKQRTDNYSADQLEDIARRKREEYFKKAQEGGN